MVHVFWGPLSGSSYLAFMLLTSFPTLDRADLGSQVGIAEMAALIF